MRWIESSLASGAGWALLRDGGELRLFVGHVCDGRPLDGMSRPLSDRDVVALRDALTAVPVSESRDAPLCNHCGGPAVGGVEFIGANPLCAEPCFALVDEEGHPATALRPGRGPCPDCAASQVARAKVVDRRRRPPLVSLPPADEDPPDVTVARTRRPDYARAVRDVFGGAEPTQKGTQP